MRYSITLLASLAVTALAVPNPLGEGALAVGRLDRRAEVAGLHIYTEAELHDPDTTRRLTRRAASPEPVPQGMTFNTGTTVNRQGSNPNGNSRDDTPSNSPVNIFSIPPNDPNVRKGQPYITDARYANFRSRQFNTPGSGSADNSRRVKDAQFSQDSVWRNGRQIQPGQEDTTTPVMTNRRQVQPGQQDDTTPVMTNRRQVQPAVSRGTYRDRITPAQRQALYKKPNWDTKTIKFAAENDGVGVGPGLSTEPVRGVFSAKCQIDLEKRCGNSAIRERYKSVSFRSWTRSFFLSRLLIDHINQSMGEPTPAMGWDGMGGNLFELLID